MYRIFIGVAIGILLSITVFQIWNSFPKSSLSPASNTQQSRVAQTSPAPTPSPIPSPSTVQDYASFISYIKDLGLGVGSETKAYSDIYSGNITEVIVNGETMYLIEYSSEDEMSKRASEISPNASTIEKTLADGSKQTINIEKSSIPTHYFKKGKIILIYAGNNESILKILEEIFGQQFAGHN